MAFQTRQAAENTASAGSARGTGVGGEKQKLAREPECVYKIVYQGGYMSNVIPFRRKSSSVTKVETRDPKIREGLALVRAFKQIRSPWDRKALLAMAKKLAKKR
jgi:hypothetical protein